MSTARVGPIKGEGWRGGGGEKKGTSTSAILLDHLNNVYSSQGTEYQFFIFNGI